MRWVGKSVPRVDGPAKVTGRALYAGDLRLSDQGVGIFVRSPHPHARILGYDASALGRVEGFWGLVTGEDLPALRVGKSVRDRTFLARGVVRFRGEPVALIAARDLRAARDAANLFRVRYQPLPAVFEMEEALARGAPLIHPDWEAYQTDYPAVRYGNVAAETVVRWGDPEGAFAGAVRVFRDRFQTTMTHQAHLEPHGAVAFPEASGLTVVASTQSPFGLRAAVAALLELPEDRVRVRAAVVGGGFGGKSQSPAGLAAALLAHRLGRPVRVVLDREEEIVGGFPRHPACVELETAVDASGGLVARRAQILLDAGAYGEFGAQTLAEMLSLVMGPYRIPHGYARGRLVYTNKPAGGAARAPGGPQAIFAGEVQIEEIAGELGLDPLEMRRINLLQPGDLTPTGQPLAEVCLPRVLSELQRAREELLSRAGPGDGIGFALGQWHSGGKRSEAEIRLQEDGHLLLLSGATDLGTGTETVLRQVAAEVMEVSPADIRVLTADTGLTPFDYASVGSRVTHNDGLAVLAAAEELRHRLLAAAAQVWETGPESLVYDRGAVRSADGARLTLRELNRFGPLAGFGTFVQAVPPHDPSRVRGHAEPARPCPTFAGQAALVSVDRETGRIRVKEVVSVHEIGRAINPAAVEGQVEGGVVFGLGQALFESVEFQEGEILNPTLLDYRIPGIADAPPVRTVLLESPGGGPFGAKGIGEPPTMIVPAAIANAVAAGTGQKIRSLPIRLAAPGEETADGVTDLVPG